MKKKNKDLSPTLPADIPRKSLQNSLAMRIFVILMCILCCFSLCLSGIALVFFDAQDYTLPDDAFDVSSAYYRLSESAAHAVPIVTSYDSLSGQDACVQYLETLLLYENGWTLHPRHSNFLFSLWAIDTETQEETLLFQTFEGNPSSKTVDTLIWVENGTEYVVTSHMKNPLVFWDQFRFMDWLFSLRNIIIWTGPISLLLLVAGFCFLLYSAGHKSNTVGIYRNWFDRLPLLFAFILICVPIALILFLSVELSYSNDLVTASPQLQIASLFFVGICISVVVLLFALFSMSIAVRIKTKTLWKNTMLYRIIRWSAQISQRSIQKIRGMYHSASSNDKTHTSIVSIYKAHVLPFALRILDTCHRVIRRFYLWTYALFQKLPPFVRGLCIFGFFLCFNFFFFALILIPYTEYKLISFFFLLCCNLGLYVLLYRQIKYLLISCAALAQGNLTHKINTKRLSGPLRVYGENLNRIGDGMATAVEEKLTSERFKTELITNISHDLKTPLTSIISYTDLLQKDSKLDTTAQEYLAILQRQSARLKKLTEDLFDAAKATSGSLPVTFSETDVSELLLQAVGEYKDRLDTAGLTPVMLLPDKPLILMTDGKHLWRIFDNLLSNICKYAMAGTRVYFEIIADAADSSQNISIIIRNITRDALDVQASFLTERFVRGDTARSTEGSGLGLSIAKSLSECIDGNLHITVDGDLFKVTLSLHTDRKQGPTPSLGT